MCAKAIKPRENLLVGSNTFYNGQIFIKGRGKITIGKYCAIGDNLRIIAGNKHNYNYPALQVTFYRNYFGKYPGAIPESGVTVGNDVWFGDNVTILDGVNIGSGSCIGTGAIVTKEVPPYTIAVGVPAKPIKRRFREDICDFLLELKWWDWTEDKIRRNKAFFHTDLNSVSTIEEIRLLICE